MYLISITGKANTGKNTLSKLLDEEIKSRFTEWKGTKFIAFADPIKKIAKIMFPNMPNKYLFGSSQYRSKQISDAVKDGSALTVRTLLTDIGTSAREYNSNIWIQVFAKTLSKCFNKKSLVVVTDVRFRNEFDYLNQLGFFKIRIYRNDVKKGTHISETSQDDIQDSEFDFIINNDGTLDDLKGQVKKIVDEIVLQ
jgi:hypothetical protein